MANMISFLSLPGYPLATKNRVEGKMLRLGDMLNDKSYKDNFTEATDIVLDIYKELVQTIYNNNQSETLVGRIKHYFNGNLTRSIYALILQDIVDVISIDNYVVDFSKYIELVEDKDDISITDNEFGTKLDAFGTKLELEIKNIDATLINSNQELDILLNKLGIVGMYYLYKAMFKVVVINLKR